MKFLGLFLLTCIIILSIFLRGYRISTVPYGLYIDEVAIGVNAYSILTKGIDEHGERFPLWFRSFGDYKPPVYIYVTSLAMAFLGKSETSIRFPSLLAGILSVGILYLLIKRMGFSIRLGLIASFLLAISPWHIQFSRAGFESNLALFIFLLGCLCAILYLSAPKIIFLISGFLLFILTTYTYHSYRVVVPFVFLTLLPFLLWKKPQMRKIILIAAAIAIFVSLPVIFYTLSSSGSARFLQITAFNVTKHPSLIENVLISVTTFIRNYASYFSSRFLFVSGDGIGRHQMVGFGLIPYWQIPFLFIGIITLFRGFFVKSPLLIYFVSFLFIVAPIPASLALPSPHTLRSLLLIIPFCITIALGMFAARKYIMRIVLLFAVVIILLSYELFFYLHYYFLHYTNNNSLDWGGGYKQTVETTSQLQSKYQHIVVRKDLGLSYVYFRFYNENLTPLYVDFAWKKPGEWGLNDTLFITSFIPDQASRPEGRLVNQTYLPNINHDIFAQFWELYR